MTFHLPRLEARAGRGPPSRLIRLLLRLRVLFLHFSTPRAAEERTLLRRIRDYRSRSASVAVAQSRSSAAFRLCSKSRLRRQ
ncbi:Hypothetical protein NTJ_04071 [Nesidiocoris tenuis]|uniref:Secreted protein n=1 Tax=Nesidiocoris tenuis TaxID=355587 RepID=A0ABN7AGT6_9HEMI|nr:Hypothetical protein NTJ_04071 [Nesidiocoris tenuis]